MTFSFSVLSLKLKYSENFSKYGVFLRYSSRVKPCILTLHLMSVFSSFARYICVGLSLPSVLKMASDAPDENVPVNLC